MIQRYTAELAEDNRSVDQILFYDDGIHQIPFFQLVASIRTGKFDVVFHTHPRFRLALMTWLARVPVRVGTGYRWYSFLFNKRVFEHRKDAAYHELEYNLHLLKSVGCPDANHDVQPQIHVREQALDFAKRVLAQRGIQEGKKLVIIHPGSGNSARDWPPVNFATLARKLSEFEALQVLLTGGRQEQSLIDRVQEMSGGRCLSIVGELNLHEFAALTKLAALFVANSTGPLHIAAAVGTPVIGLYPQVTPLSAKRWGPYTEKKTVFMPVGKPPDCTLCVRDGAKGCECMDSITPDEVFDAARRMLMMN